MSAAELAVKNGAENVGIIIGPGRYVRVGIEEPPSRPCRQIAEIPHIPSKHNHFRGDSQLVVDRVRRTRTFAVGNEALRTADRSRWPPQRHVLVRDVQHDDTTRGQVR
ncbi:hypothetical protein V1281_001414 [Nitrobacteraceae bacterium AZCC 2161]